MNSLQYTFSVHASSSQLLNVSSHLKSTQVDIPLSSQVESDVFKSTAVDFGSFSPHVRSRFCTSATRRSICYALVGITVFNEILCNITQNVPT